MKSQRGWLNPASDGRLDEPGQVPITEGIDLSSLKLWNRASQSLAQLVQVLLEHQQAVLPNLDELGDVGCHLQV